MGSTAIMALAVSHLLSIVLFVYLAKRYKLRERNKEFNIQAIVEEHYEKYLDQEEEYMRNMANQYHVLDPSKSKDLCCCCSLCLLIPNGTK